VSTTTHNKVPGLIGASDIFLQLCYLLDIAVFVYKHEIDVEVCWDLNMDQGRFPEDIQSPAYQMDYVLDNLYDSKYLNLTHSYNHPKDKIQAWGHNHMYKEIKKNTRVWPLIEKEKTIKNKIVYWNINDNEYRGMNWKYSLTNDDWDFIKTYLGDYTFTQINYRSPIETVVKEIDSADIVICHHGMWYQLAKNFFKPILCLVNTTQKPKNMPWGGEHELHVINKPTIADFDDLVFDFHLKSARTKAKESRKKYYDIRKSCR